MSRSHHQFLAILPLFAVLGLSPMQLQMKSASRSIAMSIDGENPKYEARSLKIDRTKIVVESDVDLKCFADKMENYTDRLVEQLNDYKKDLVTKDEFEAQKGRVRSLVLGLVDLEENYKVLKEKKLFDKVEDSISKSINNLKSNLETLLESEVENELAYVNSKLKPKAEIAKAEVVAPAPAPAATSSEDLICDLQEKNKVLTSQVSELMTQQKAITDSLLSMNNVLTQMYQQQSIMMERMQYPPMNVSGSMVNPQQQYQYLPAPTAGGAWIYYPSGISQPQPQQPQQFAQQPFEQIEQPYQQPQQQQRPQIGQQYYNQQQAQLDLQYGRPMDMNAGNFGTSPFMYNFSPTPQNRMF